MATLPPAAPRDQTGPTRTPPRIIADPREAARAAGLRYVTDSGPGIRRQKAGQTFRYIGTDGRPLRDRRQLARIKALGIPPAYTDVWICPLPNGHIQATGRDAKGRKQYRYHPYWREVRDGTKYGRLIAFGEALPRIRQSTAEDLALPGLPRAKVLATVVRLLEDTLIRVGNGEYARKNGHFGLTTLCAEHVEVGATTVRFHFVGKAGKEHTVAVSDRRLARVVKQLHELPGHQLFYYRDAAGELQTIDSADVNDYLRQITGQEITAKDFRTWAGTVLAVRALKECAPFDSPTQAKRNVTQAVQSVASRLGNTPAICRRCYIHPAVIEAYLDGVAMPALTEGVEDQEGSDALPALRPEEAAVIAFLQCRGARDENARAVG